MFMPVVQHVVYGPEQQGVPVDRSYNSRLRGPRWKSGQIEPESARLFVRIRRHRGHF